MPARKKMPPPMRLFKVRARSIYRKTRADQGAIGLWFILGVDEEAVKAQWLTIVPIGDWEIDVVTPSLTNWVRVS